MLTGGQSAERIYAVWSEHPTFHQMRGVTFFFGDERCVPPSADDSNYGMAMRTLFQHGVPANCSVYRMEADDKNREAAATRYERALPQAIDVLLLGAGEDGHIASLFPGSEALREAHRDVLPVIGPKLPRDRLTITPKVIARARHVFVFAPGPSKAAVLSEATRAPSEFDVFPARLAINAVWLLDAALPAAIVN